MVIALGHEEALDRACRGARPRSLLSEGPCAQRVQRIRERVAVYHLDSD